MSVTFAVIIVTAVISIMAFSNRDTLMKLMLYPPDVFKRNQYYRLVSSGFVHSDYSHLIFNMLSFYFFAGFVENYFIMRFPDGQMLFLLLYLSAIVISDLPTLFKQKNNTYYYSLGASGGVAAVIFSSIILAPTNRIYVYFIAMPAFVWGPLYLAYSVWQARKGQTGINHDAHFYGSLYGALFTLLLVPEAATGFVQQLMAWRF